jgi:hypothetical protein
MCDRRNDGYISAVGCNDCTWRKLVSRAARAVGSDRDIVPLLERPRQSNQRAAGTARSRSTNECVAHPLENSRDYLTVAVFTHQHCNSLIAMKPQEWKHLPVPEREEDRFLSRAQRSGSFLSNSAVFPRRRESSDCARTRDYSGTIAY